MCAVVVLVSHEHDPAVPQRARVLVLHIVLEPENLLDGPNLRIERHLLRRLGAYVEDLAAQREHAIPVAAHLRETSDGKRLG